MEDQEVMTVREVATRLRCGPATVYVLVRSGRLGSLKLGGHYRIPMEALRAFLAEQSKPVVPDAAS